MKRISGIWRVSIQVEKNVVLLDRMKEYENFCDCMCRLWMYVNVCECFERWLDVRRRGIW